MYVSHYTILQFWLASRKKNILLSKNSDALKSNDIVSIFKQDANFSKTMTIIALKNLHLVSSGKVETILQEY